ncbi:MAG: rRNA pseudouridine synthase [Chloroflexi bacterium]|nr:rRNA pseudouridine synthase [Chloroflexota bacterium]
MTRERVQKILAQAGVGSRRANEKLILAGRVQVNGRAIRLGEKADVDLDEIKLDGKLIRAKQSYVYLAVNKPRGVLSTTVHKDDRKTVLDLVPQQERLYPVGRLDADSEGLLLLTNDGDLTQQLSHPRFGHEKEYRVLVARNPDREQLATWRPGVVLEDGFKTAPARVWVEKEKGKGAWLRVVLKEGHKRQIRETTRVLGLPVVKLIRVRIGTLELGSLKPGKWRKLTSKEVTDLGRKVEQAD